MARLKDGFQLCQKCGGGGCYWCRRAGWRAQCPVCGNSEPELLERGENDEFTCRACSAGFDKTGHATLAERSPKRPKKP